MNMISMRYLFPLNGNATGRIKTTADCTMIEANGLHNASDYLIIACNEEGHIRKEETFRSTAQGDLYLKFNTISKDNLFLICQQNKVILYDSDMDEENARKIIWQYHQKENRKNENAINQKDSLVNNSIQPDIQSDAASPANEKFREHTGEAADQISVILWPDEIKNMERYFERCPPEKVSLIPDNAFSWKFVKTQAASGDFQCECLLGRHVQDERVNAMAVMIDQTQIPEGAMLPGYQYQKSPDGRGFWIHIQEFKGHS